MKCYTRELLVHGILTAVVIVFQGVIGTVRLVDRLRHIEW